MAEGSGSGESASGSSSNSGKNVPDCTACRVVGAGGCFAGAIYAFHQRSQLPTTNRNRHWLAVIGLGQFSLTNRKWFAIKCHTLLCLCPRIASTTLID